MTGHWSTASALALSLKASDKASFVKQDINVTGFVRQDIFNAMNGEITQEYRICIGCSGKMLNSKISPSQYAVNQSSINL